MSTRYVIAPTHEKARAALRASGLDAKPLSGHPGSRQLDELHFDELHVFGNLDPGVLEVVRWTQRKRGGQVIFHEED